MAFANTRRSIVRDIIIDQTPTPSPFHIRNPRSQRFLGRPRRPIIRTLYPLSNQLRRPRLEKEHSSRR